MPLFFSSSALYPEKIMPGWLQVIPEVNPLSYEVEALRGLLIGTATIMWLDTVVLVDASCSRTQAPWSSASAGPSLPRRLSEADRSGWPEPR